MVHASERPIARLRMGLWRCQSAGACLGRLAGLQDREEAPGRGRSQFLERIFHKLLLNFTWWVNRKDADGRNIFQGGFLGLDNIGVFDRSAPLPTGGHIEQSDATSWMGMYCLNMLAIALELARENPVYEDVASKFFEHFVYICDAMNNLGGDGIELWNIEDGFYYDVLQHARRQASADEGAVNGRTDPALCGRNVGLGDRRRFAGLQAAHAVVHRKSPGVERAHRNANDR